MNKIKEKPDYPLKGSAVIRDLRMNAILKDFISTENPLSKKHCLCVDYEIWSQIKNILRLCKNFAQIIIWYEPWLVTWLNVTEHPFQKSVISKVWTRKLREILSVEDN